MCTAAFLFENTDVARDSRLFIRSMKNRLIPLTNICTFSLESIRDSVHQPNL